jgi:hypothetical protein
MAMTYFINGHMAGFLASPYYAEMCVPFHLHLSRITANGNPFSQQMLYIAGRNFIYAVWGVLARLMGHWLG